MRVQGPIKLNDYSMPQPDLTLVQRQAWRQLEDHPSPKDILALVEVSDSTLDYDRNDKALLYAREGIRELWIVNLKSMEIEVYRQPSPQGYLKVETYGPDQPISFGLGWVEYQVSQMFEDVPEPTS